MKTHKYPILANGLASFLLAIALSIIFLDMGIDRAQLAEAKVNKLKAIEYRIGSIDKRFGISKDQVEQIVQKSMEAWNQAYDCEVLALNLNASKKINFVFDQRQSQIRKRRDLIQKKEKYERELAAYNREVVDWNAKGGAPKEIYQTLMQRKNALEEQRQKLVEALTEFNNSVKEKQIQGFHYSSGDIEIFYFSSKEELVAILTHEFGHALRIKHSSNPQSIMARVGGEKEVGWKDKKITEKDIIF